VTWQWHEQHRRRAPKGLLHRPVAILDRVAIFACPGGVVAWNFREDTTREQSLGYTPQSLAAHPSGLLACVGEEHATILNSDFRTLTVFGGKDRPDANSGGTYAFSDSYFWYLRRTDQVDFVVRRIGSWEAVADLDISDKWTNAPTRFFDVGNDVIYAECPQAKLARVLTVVPGELSFRSLVFRGRLLAFLAQAEAFVCDWDGRTTVCKFPSGKKIRTLRKIERLTPITVPDVFTTVAAARGATAANAETMFDDILVTKEGKEPPFPSWTGAVDGQTILAYHEDATLRIWRVDASS
jgi:hypothetical protein